MKRNLDWDTQIDLLTIAKELISRLVDSQAQGRAEIDGTWPAYYTDFEIETLKEKVSRL